MWIPLVPAWSVEKQKKDEQYRNFSSVHFCIPWGILANVKISHLPAWSEGLCDLFPLCVALGLHPRAMHEGNKSHNPSLQADNPYKITWVTNYSLILASTFQHPCIIIITVFHKWNYNVAMATFPAVPKWRPGLKKVTDYEHTAVCHPWY